MSTALDSPLNIEIMIKFWTLGILIFIVVTVILAKLTLKDHREKAGEKMWKLWNGRSTYWRLLSLVSFGLTVGIMFVLHLTGVIVL